MKSSETIQSDVVDELAYDSEVDSSRIAVTTRGDGVVVLEGSVPTYMQLGAAERATKRVEGVRAVVNDLEVNPLPADGGDIAIAKNALRCLRWSASIPRNAVRVAVSEGWVTLEGKVDWEYQKRAATNAVSDLVGVKGVSNTILIEPKIEPSGIKREIADSFRRNAQVDADRVTVEVEGSTVTLRGSVGTFAEKEAAERAAWAARGVSHVTDLLEVRSHALV